MAYARRCKNGTCGDLLVPVQRPGVRNKSRLGLASDIELGYRVQVKIRVSVMIRV